jgi:hypothetical protein
MILRKSGKFNEAEAALKKALTLATRLESMESVKNASENLYLLYSEKERHKPAFDYYKRFVEARDKIFNEENTRKSVQAQMQYQFDKKEAAIKADQDKKDALAKEEDKKQTVIRNSFISGFILVFLLAILIYRGYRNKKKANVVITLQKEEVEKAKTVIEKQKHLVEEKQKEILDSIHYARRIQRSLLTQDKYLEKNLQRLLKKSA